MRRSNSGQRDKVEQARAAVAQAFGGTVRLGEPQRESTSLRREGCQLDCRGDVLDCDSGQSGGSLIASRSHIQFDRRTECLSPNLTAVNGRLEAQGGNR